MKIFWKVVQPRNKKWETCNSLSRYILIESCKKCRIKSDVHQGKYILKYKFNVYKVKSS